MTRDVVAIIVNYNSGPLLDGAVRSLLAGSVVPAIHVVDNASTDDSLERLRDGAARGANVEVIANRSNRGFAAANNQVLRNRGARYYLLMNPDCVVEPDAVAAFVDFMTGHPDVGLAGGLLRNADGTVQKTSRRRFPTPLSSLARTLGLHRFRAVSGKLADFDLGESAPGGDEADTEAISGALMFVRDAALTDTGLLDEGYFMHCEDLDWCRRFWDAGWKVAHVASAEAMHLKGGSGRSARVIWHLHQGMIRFYRKHYRAVYPAPLAGLVYAGVYLRCFALMALNAFRTRS